jgi:hypothetical protein
MQNIQKVLALPSVAQFPSTDFIASSFQCRRPVAKPESARRERFSALTDENALPAVLPSRAEAFGNKKRPERGVRDVFAGGFCTYIAAIASSGPRPRLAAILLSAAT